MAVTQFANIINPQRFGQYTSQLSDKASLAIQSGLLAPDPTLASIFAGGGTFHTLPFWNALADVAANVSGSDPAVFAAAKALTADSQAARRIDRNDHWGTADLAVMMAGSDPFGALIGTLGNSQGGLVTWITEQRQRSLMATLAGLYASNAAATSDMIHKAGVADTASGAAIAPADLIGPAAVAGAEATLGDAGANLPIMVCHSGVARNIKLSNLMTTVNAAGVPSSQFVSLANQPLMWSEYLRKIVIVDDNCPAVADAARIAYTSYLFGPGAIRYAPLVPKVPLEFDRIPLAGNGGGVDQVSVRIAHVMHPWGWKVTVTGETATDAQLALAATWTRVEKRKNIKMAFLVTNG